MIKIMENLRRIALMAAPILVLGIFGVLIWAFSGTSGKRENGETAPADAVENFHSLLLSGKWDEAEAMCGSGMDRYISSFREEWEMNMDKDSSVLEAAVRILREQGITVTGTSKGKDGKYFVDYTISAGEETKEKTAELKRDGERWTIERIRDAKAR